MTAYKVRLNGQNRRIFDMLVRYLREGITSHDAQREEGVDRLASRIHDLHTMGIQTRVVMEKVRDRYGATTRVARYFLITKQPITIVNEQPVRAVAVAEPEDVEDEPQAQQEALPW